MASIPPNAPTDPACISDMECEARTELPSVDAWTNSRCVYDNAVYEFGCKLFSIEGGDCPGAGSSGLFEYPCDTGLSCVQVAVATWWSASRYECQLPSMDIGMGSGLPVAIYGCTDPTATNYDPTATMDDGSCVAPVYGCMQPTASNYDPWATVEDGTCIWLIWGCTDPSAINFNPNADIDDGSCIRPRYGCTDSSAINYDPFADTDDGSCMW